MEFKMEKNLKPGVAGMMMIPGVFEVTVLISHKVPSTAYKHKPIQEKFTVKSGSIEGARKEALNEASKKYPNDDKVFQPGPVRTIQEVTYKMPARN